MNDEWLVIDTPELKRLYAPMVPGDQYRENMIWHECLGVAPFNPSHNVEYRRLRSKAWLAVKDVPPQIPCWMADAHGYIRHCGKDHDNAGAWNLSWTHWQPAPKYPPPPQEDWQSDYEKWRDRTEACFPKYAKDAFKAGWEARGK